MSSNYAFIPTTLTEQTAVAQTAELPVFKELAFDFETGQLKTMGVVIIMSRKTKQSKYGYGKH